MSASFFLIISIWLIHKSEWSWEEEGVDEKLFLDAEILGNSQVILLNKLLLNHQSEQENEQLPPSFNRGLPSTL